MKKIIFITLMSMFGIHANSQNDSIAKASMQKTATELFLAKDYIGAIDVYSKMLLAFPDNLEIIHSRATMYMMASNYTEAMSDFTKLIDSNYRNLAEAYYFRALCKTVNHYPACEDFLKAKFLGYNTEGANLKYICPELNKN